MLTSRSYSAFDEFLNNFRIYYAVYRRLEISDESTASSETLAVGDEPSLGIRSWTKRDLEDLLRRKNLHHFFAKIDRTPNLEKHLIEAFKAQGGEARIEALCEIPGVGPVLASVILESMSPEMYGALSCHAWYALRLLGFDLPKKRVNCDSFSVHELLKYLEIVRMLARENGTTPAQMEKALYAFDKTVTDKRWERQFTLILRRFTTPVLSPNGRG